ncbi:deleted in lung and esophageal cancer protein 1 homolog [Clytia hemisphaerica]|uniref:deleted in lung and esophageal cancer protein 1 homolog n=1 Tax=Clytia hemisphaerica TaxID=252671 RepID=UPI0034D5D7EA
MEEPSMLKQRPSSSHTQDTSHIIMSTFRDLFSQGGMRQDLIENLSVSKGGENVYHDKYVEKLQNIHERWATKITAIDDMIQHLDKAKAQARILELQEEAKAKKEYAFYQDLGLPSVPSRLNHFLNCKRLRENGLVVPNEFLDYKSEPIAIEESVEQAIPQYASSTFSSRQQFDKLPKDDNYLPKPEPILPKLSKVGSEDTKIQTRKSQALASRSEKNVWRKCLPPKQREDEKKEIMKLQQRADFLKNPRFLPDPRSLVKTFKKDAVATIRHEESYFQANPHPVLFNGYEVGFSYQLKLELKNITAASRQLRLIEPKTNYFSLKMGDFPSTNGLVAPGMSCTFTIQFTPETLEDYNDQIEVKTMGEGSLVIPLQGRRKPPILNLPDEINCGHCLVGDVKTKDFVIQNTGGLGRFCFINADEVNTTQIDWDQLNYDSEEGLLMTNFIISPRIFSLQENESVIIKVVFSPEGVKSFLSGIVLLCDNCVKNSHHIIGIGEVADIELISVEGGLHEPILGETQDLQAEQIVRFQECYPDVVYTKTLLIKNRIPVPMDYEWIISPPQVTSNALTINSGDAIETSSPFHIHPSSGVLDEEAEQCFQIIFSPTSIDHWFNVATFSMKNIPVKNEEEEDKYFYQNQDFLQISIKGQTQPYNVKVEPGFVALSGRNFCGITYYKTVTLVNKSGSCASFQWQNVDTVRCSVACDPSNGSIDGNSSMEFLVAITGKKEGRVDVEIPYHVQSSVTDSRLHLQAHFVEILHGQLPVWKLQLVRRISLAQI